ncbi:MAG: hypothetical protein ABI853_01240 [Sphingomicrobium sp.]
MEQQQQEQARQTGTRNETYDVIAVLYHALQGAENCQIYAGDARDEPTRGFFQQALSAQRHLADQGKQLLQQVLQKDTGAQSAFGWQTESQVGASTPVQSTATEGQTNPDRTF